MLPPKITNKGAGKRALFIIPPYLTTDALTADLFPMPHAAVQLAAVLRVSGWVVEIKDFLIPMQAHTCKAPAVFAGKYAPPYRHYGQTFDECETWIKTNNKRFDVVGLCAGQCNLWEGVVKIANMVRAAGLPLVIGGAFVTTATADAHKLFGSAIYVVGEGETVVTEAFSKAAEGITDEILWAIARPDLDTLPLPSWDLVDFAAYPHVSNKLRGVLAITRGCPWHCVFCSVATVAGRRHRRLSCDNIRRRIEQLYAAGVRRVCFLDDNLFISEQATDELLGIIETLREGDKGYKHIRWYVEEGMEVRIAAVPGIVQRMKAVGFDKIHIGLETANSAKAIKNKKPFTDEQVVAALQNFREAGIIPMAFYIIGLPGDTLESVATDLVVFGKMGIDVRANNLKIYPGTQVETMYRERGLIGLDYDWRMSSFYTPEADGLSPRIIRRMKTYLKAIGTMANEFGLRVFASGIADLVKKEAVEYNDKELVWRRKFFRPTSYRRALELMLLADGADGAVSEVHDDYLVAKKLLKPVDEIQAAIVAALRPHTITKKPTFF